jgi:hypothetical protein
MYMEAAFYILLNLRTPYSFENFARFELGTDREFAYSLFTELDGSSEVTANDALTIELVETKAGLPLNLKIISCSLDQLAANCRHLTKEIFKKRTLA